MGAQCLELIHMGSISVTRFLMHKIGHSRDCCGFITLCNTKILFWSTPRFFFFSTLLAHAIHWHAKLARGRFPSVGGGGGRGPPYKKDRVALQKFWKEALRDTKILCCGCGLKFLSPLSPNSYIKHLSSVIIFLAPITQKGAAKAPDVNFFLAIHPGKYQAQFFDP